MMRILFFFFSFLFFNSNAFVWRGFINLRAKRTSLDQLEVIRVETGNIGYCYRSGTKIKIYHFFYFSCMNYFLKRKHPKK